MFPESVNNLITEFEKLPGIGHKTAIRLAFYILESDEGVAKKFATVLVDAKQKVKFCEKCFNLSEGNVCSICSNPKRDTSVICVVENVKDVKQYIERIDEMIERKRSFMEKNGLL